MKLPAFGSNRFQFPLIVARRKKSFRLRKPPLSVFDIRGVPRHFSESKRKMCVSARAIGKIGVTFAVVAPLLSNSSVKNHFSKPDPAPFATAKSCLSQKIPHRDVSV